jgi:hypothetical protein
MTYDSSMGIFEDYEHCDSKKDKMTEKKEWHIEGGDGWNIFEGRRIVANCGGYSSNFEDTTEWKKANAKIIETAINSCKSINPSNPQIVAESIEEMYELMVRIRKEYKEFDADEISFDDVDALLNKLEEK